MTTNTLNHLQASHYASWINPVKLVVSVLALAYGIFNFSVHYWVFLALFVVAMLAISDRLSRLTATPDTSSKQQKRFNADGGSFSKTEVSRVTGNVTPVVQDGGIYNRKH